ncbi:MAG: hypothetical protein JWQ40_2171 [Segetibacter sp.]|nr:hypothetical protein [Segetibacter sp.]
MKIISYLVTLFLFSFSSFTNTYVLKKAMKKKQ